MAEHNVIDITVGKKRVSFVAGLEWHPLHEVGAARNREITAYARSVGAEFKVLRPGDTHHVGLASKVGGAKIGQVSAAAVVANHILADGRVRNALFVTRFPGPDDLFLMVTLRNGVILPDGDLVGSGVTIREQLNVDAAYDGGWDLVICPSEWGILGSEEINFTTILEASTLPDLQALRLREINFAWMKFVIPLVLAALVGAGGAYGWKAWKQKQVLDRARKVAQAEEQLRLAQRPVESPKPWTNQPMPLDFAMACQQGMDRMGLDIGNWSFVNSICEDGVVTVTWQKSDDQAWISHLLAVRPDANVSPDGVMATASIQTPAYMQDIQQDQLPQAHQTRLRHYDMASQYGLAILVEPESKSSPTSAALPGQAPVAASPPVGWKAYSVSLTTSMEPAAVARILAFPGLRLTRLVATSLNGELQYKISGVQYVQS